MSGWSSWCSVAEMLDAGREDRIPWEIGIYKFRVKPDHPAMGGQVVYVGRGGFEEDKNTSSICSRVGTFISAAMGFWTAHSGGNNFRKDRDAGKHSLNVRDLEVSWKLDPDSKCAEAEEYLSMGSKPRFNRQRPSTCKREGCSRTAAIWNTHEVW